MPWHKDHLDILNRLAVLIMSYLISIPKPLPLQKAGLVARGRVYDDKDYQYGEELTRIARLQIRLGQYEEAEKSISRH